MPSSPGSFLPFDLGAAAAGVGTGVDTGASLDSLYAGEYVGRPTGVWF